MMHISEIQEVSDLQPCFFYSSKPPLFIQIYLTITIKILYLTVKLRKYEILKQTKTPSLPDKKPDFS